MNQAAIKILDDMINDCDGCRQANHYYAEIEKKILASQWSSVKEDGLPLDGKKLYTVVYYGVPVVCYIDSETASLKNRETGRPIGTEGITIWSPIILPKDKA